MDEDIIIAVHIEIPQSPNKSCYVIPILSIETRSLLQQTLLLSRVLANFRREANAGDPFYVIATHPLSCETIVLFYYHNLSQKKCIKFKYSTIDALYTLNEVSERPYDYINAEQFQELHIRSPTSVIAQQIRLRTAIELKDLASCIIAPSGKIHNVYYN